MEKNDDKLILGGKEFSSRFILGSGKYSLNLIEAAIKDAGAEIITLAVRRANTKEQENILDFIPKGVTLLPNTSGARDAKEIIFTASGSEGDNMAIRGVLEANKNKKHIITTKIEHPAVLNVYKYL